jgi:hypothetical protein
MPLLCLLLLALLVVHCLLLLALPVMAVASRCAHAAHIQKVKIPSQHPQACQNLAIANICAAVLAKSCAAAPVLRASMIL